MPFGGLLTAGVLTAGGLAMKGYNAYKAGKDQDKAQKALDELSKQPYDTYKATPEMQGYYSKVLGGVNNPIGMTAAEKAAAKNNVSNAINTTLYNVKGQTGGNMARYLSGAFTPQIANAANQIAVTDANMRNQNYFRNLSMLGSAAGQFQNLSNMNTTNSLNRRMMREQALGNSILQNKAFKTQMLEGMGSDLIGAGLTMGMGGGTNPIGNVLSQRRQRRFNNSVKTGIQNTLNLPYDEAYFDTSGLD